MKIAIHWKGIVLASLLFGSPLGLQGQVILGNLAGFTNRGSSTDIENISGGFGKGYGFTMGATSYQLGDVKLDLNVNTGATPSVQLWAASGASPNNPGTLVATLVNPTFTYNTAGDYTFTPTAPITLAASTSYYITVTNGSSTSQMLWYVGGPTVTPTSQIGATMINAIYGAGNTAPTTWTTTSGAYNWIQIDDDAVPEPPVAALLFSAMAWLGFEAWGRRRRCRAVIQ